MSDHNHDASDNLIVGLVGKAFYILFPVILIVMMGVVGAAFIGGGGHKEGDANLPDAIRPKKERKFGKEPLPPFDKEEKARLMAIGEKNWVNCMACHGANGEGGAANMAPPLVGSKILMGDPEASLAAVHKGIIKAPDSKWVGMMVGLVHLDDEKVAGLLTYARNSFGNEGYPISVEQSAEIRKKYAEKSGSFTREEIEALAGE